jgi:hypothetical protein
MVKQDTCVCRGQLAGIVLEDTALVEVVQVLSIKVEVLVTATASVLTHDVVVTVETPE